MARTFSLRALVSHRNSQRTRSIFQTSGVPAMFPAARKTSITVARHITCIVPPVHRGGNHALFISSKPRHPSSSATEFLARTIESEIKIAQESDDHDRIEEIPKGFPFKLDDNVGTEIVTLTREYDGEVTKVDVHMPDLVTGQDHNSSDDDDKDEGGTPPQSSIPLIVTIPTGGGMLEFHCIAYPFKIKIKGLVVKSSKPSHNQIAYSSFRDLDEKLKKTFSKYLDIRGVRPDTTMFLHEYMINKDSREYLHWLKKLKIFIEA